MPVVHINFSNGAGNNIFQYVYARLLAEELDAGFSHPALPVLGIPENRLPFNPANETVRIDQGTKKPFDLHGLLNNPDLDVNYDLRIYPEDFTLYTPRIDRIRSWFPKVEKTNTDDLVMHLRMGDRLLMSSTYTPENYVKPRLFMDAIDSFDFDKLYIVTDMPVWGYISPSDVSFFKFHRDVKEKDRAQVSDSVDYFNALYSALKSYNPIVHIGNTVQDDFNFMRSFDKIMFQHGTLAWWAAALSDASDVALYGKWRNKKGINLGWTDLPGWRQWGPKTAPTHDVKVYHLKKLASQYGLRTFVETGTKGGTTIEDLQGHFDRLYSVEILEDVYEKAKRKLGKYPHVKLYCGDSAKVLPEILKEIHEPALFWLDAHDGRNSTPVLDELRSIMRNSPYPHLICIDDCRYIGKESAWPNIAELFSIVDSRIPKPRKTYTEFDSWVVVL